MVVSPTTIKDPHETDPARRYKMLALESPPFGLYAAFSPDGIRWRRRSVPVLTAANDPQLNDRPTMMHDLERRRYVALTGGSGREITLPVPTNAAGSAQRLDIQIGTGAGTYSGDVYVDFHGHDPAKGKNFWVRYEEAGQEQGITGRSGSLVAPFDGQHGWYFLNTSQGPVTIELTVTGYFDRLVDLRLPQQ